MKRREDLILPLDSRKISYFFIINREYIYIIKNIIENNPKRSVPKRPILKPLVTAKLTISELFEILTLFTYSWLLYKIEERLEFFE